MSTKSAQDESQKPGLQKAGLQEAGTLLSAFAKQVGHAAGSIARAAQDLKAGSTNILSDSATKSESKVPSEGRSRPKKKQSKRTAPRKHPVRASGTKLLATKKKTNKRSKS